MKRVCNNEIKTSAAAGGWELGCTAIESVFVDAAV